MVLLNCIYSILFTQISFIKKKETQFDILEVLKTRHKTI